MHKLIIVYVCCMLTACVDNIPTEASKAVAEACYKVGMMPLIEHNSSQSIATCVPIPSK